MTPATVTGVQILTGILIPYVVYYCMWLLMLIIVIIVMRQQGTNMLFHALEMAEEEN
jgi:hypothetical protein